MDQGLCPHVESSWRWCRVCFVTCLNHSLWLYWSEKLEFSFNTRQNTMWKLNNLIWKCFTFFKIRFSYCFCLSKKNADSSPKIGWPHKKDVDPFCTFARWSGGDPVHLSTTGEMRKARAASLHGDKRLDHPANSSEAALAKKRCSHVSENANFAIWSLANCSTNALIVL